MDLLVMLVLGLVAILCCIALGVQALLTFANWRDFRNANRQRRACGLPPLSGMHRGR